MHLLWQVFFVRRDYQIMSQYVQNTHDVTPLAEFSQNATIEGLHKDLKIEF